MVKVKRVERSDAPDIIFDFDGTIANTLPILIEVAEQLSITEMPLTIELVEELRGLPAQQILKRVGIPLRKVPALVTRGRKELIVRLAEAKPFKGMLEVIQELSKSSNLYVMSSNSDQNIKQFFKTYGFDQYFQAIYGNVSLFGKTKGMKKIIKLENLDKSRVIYVGDETRDIEAAHKIKIKVASVTWGYNNKQILSKFKPDYMVSRPEELLQLIK